MNLFEEDLKVLKYFQGRRGAETVLVWPAGDPPPGQTGTLSLVEDQLDFVLIG